MYSGLTSVATFTVNSSGTISLRSELGRRVVRQRNQDAQSQWTEHLGQRDSPIANATTALGVSLIVNGAEVDKLPFATSAIQSFTLLPLTGFGYQFDVDGSSPADLSFNIDLAGYVHIPSTQTYVATGEARPRSPSAAFTSA